MARSIQAGELPDHRRLPEAITLSKEADVRIGGVSVGKVKSLGLAPESECHTDTTVCNATRATIEIEPQYASDLLGRPGRSCDRSAPGETYIELTRAAGAAWARRRDLGSELSAAVRPVQHDRCRADLGRRRAASIPEGGHLAQTQVQNQTQIDEIFQGFDRPTREAFQSWMQNSSLAITARSRPE